MVYTVRIKLRFKRHTPSEGNAAVFLSGVACLCQPSAAVKLDARQVRINGKLPAAFFIVKHSGFSKITWLFIQAIVIVISDSVNNSTERFINFFADFMHFIKVHHCAMNCAELSCGKLAFICFRKEIGIDFKIMVFNGFRRISRKIEISMVCWVCYCLFIA